MWCSWRGFLCLLGQLGGSCVMGPHLPGLIMAVKKGRRNQTTGWFGTPARGVRVLWLQRKNSRGLQKSCGEKGTAWPLSERGHWPLPGQAFIAFLSTLHLRMVLIYYAQVGLRWLPFTENKGEVVANYIKEEGYLQMQREKWLNWLHRSLGGLA